MKGKSFKGKDIKVDKPEKPSKETIEKQKKIGRASTEVANNLLEIYEQLLDKMEQQHKELMSKGFSKQDAMDAVINGQTIAHSSVIKTLFAHNQAGRYLQNLSDRTMRLYMASGEIFEKPEEETEQ